MHWIALPLPWRDEPRAWPTAAGKAGPAATGGAAPVPAHLLTAAAAGWWALRFTPRVVLLDGDTVLLEVSSTERLWGGRGVLLALVLQAWADACGGLADAVAGDEVGGQTTGPPTAVWGCGPTALVAQALLRMALAGRWRRPHGHTEQEGGKKGTVAADSPLLGPPSDGILKGLPLHTLTALRPHMASLERMGCRTWGALRALPRAGVARRFGAGVLRVLDQALGDAPEVHAWLELPEQFEITTELPAPAELADALLWGAHRSLTALQGWLQGRQQGALALELVWRHDLRRIDGVAIAPTQALQVRTAQATQDMAHLRRLLSENLARTALAAPVNQITLRLLESAPLPHRSASLLPPGDRGAARDDPSATQGEALHQLLERLSARLGADHVQTPVLQADHRPERMQQWCPATEVLGLAAAMVRPATRPAASHAPASAVGSGLDASPDALLLPTWLLNPPRQLAVQGNRPCHHGLLRLLAGPHRFEAGWWTAVVEGEDPAHPCAGLALRDYFIAHNDVAGLVWVFRERLAPVPSVSDGPPAAVRLHRWFLHGVFG